MISLYLIRNGYQDVEALILFLELVNESFYGGEAAEVALDDIQHRQFGSQCTWYLISFIDQHLFPFVEFRDIPQKEKKQGYLCEERGDLCE